MNPCAGQKRRFADGGLPDPNGSDFDAINAERTQRWASEDAANKAKYGLTNPLDFKAPSAPTGIASPLSSIASGSSFAPKTQSITNPLTTTFDQDLNARQERIDRYANKLRDMEANGRANSLMGSSSTMTKPSLGFADGGKIDPDELMRQMNAKYGAPVASPAAPQSATTGPMSKAAQAAPQVAPPLQAPPKPQGIINTLRNRQQQIDLAAGYAQGGKPGISIDALRNRRIDEPDMSADIAPVGMEPSASNPPETGYKVEGPGTATSDSIPAEVKSTGEPIRIANGERIVSVEQDKVLEQISEALGYGSLDEMFEAMTGAPVGPTIRSGRRAAAHGLDTKQDMPYSNEGRVTRNDIALPEQSNVLNSDPRSANDQADGYAKNALEDRAMQLVRKNTGASDADPVPSGIRVTRQAGTNAPMAVWNSNADAAAKSIENDRGKMGSQVQDGTGLISVKQKDGSYKNMSIDKPEYTAADGSTTSDWSKTAQYQQGMQQAQRDKVQLAEMQRDRVERTAYDPTITDPNVKSNALAQIAEMDARAAKANDVQAKLLDSQNKQLEGQIKREQLAESTSQRTARENLNAAIDSGDPKQLKTARQKAEVAGIKTNGQDDVFGLENGPSVGKGNDALAGLSQQTAEQVKALAEGRIPFPSGMALKSPYWQRMTSLVSAYDPTFDAINYNARSNTRKDFTSGKSAQAITAFNTALGHIENLEKAGESLKNTDYPMINTATNWVNNQLGNENLRSFNIAKDAVTGELVKAFNNGHITEGQLKEWGNNISNANSPEQMRAVNKQLVSLLSSKINSMGDQYNAGMGTTKQGVELLNPHAQEVYKRILGAEPPANSTGNIGQVAKADSQGRPPLESFRIN